MRFKYSVVPVPWPYRFQQDLYSPDDHLEDVLEWCRDNFSSEVWRWSAYTLTFHFAEESHAFAFRMRWC